ncbi:hypothetical protein BN381_80290 [Candidatus Microthrix parvicella RN1]|uniref:Uncharacterized protein n=1 Tax=Candidatus Neomicrothrix parvicella RN1 TaxID=1229780 RepID=R4Z4Y9_9ACTN|nr:hypothetical protein BN381_80290 [Candidatus Microthrix parvicella RN1]
MVNGPFFEIGRSVRQCACKAHEAQGLFASDPAHPPCRSTQCVVRWFVDDGNLKWPTWYRRNGGGQVVSSALR